MLELTKYLDAIEGVNHTPDIDPGTILLTGAYVCDMLSDVMGSAKAGQAWITIMKHLNVIAVASMTGIPAIVFAKGSAPDQAVADKATEEGICLVSSKLDTFSLAGILYKLLNP
jgi:serine kinase of HPr protein (carbohydrate metabolism regulator)